jgi:hypothetical protein
MTNSASWVQNRGQYNRAGGQATARRPKLRVERRPFLAPEAVIVGVDFTGPYILVVTCRFCTASLSLLHSCICPNHRNSPSSRVIGQGIQRGDLYSPNKSPTWDATHTFIGIRPAAGVLRGLVE